MKRWNTRGRAEALRPLNRDVAPRDKYRVSALVAQKAAKSYPVLLKRSGQCQIRDTTLLCRMVCDFLSVQAEAAPPNLTRSNSEDQLGLIPGAAGARVE
jgi:hypothetical protein